MKKIENINKEIHEYAIKKYDDDATIFEPLIIKENNNLFLCYLILEYVDIDNRDYRIKKPTKWIVADIKNGNIIEKEGDQLINKILSKIDTNEIFENEGNTNFYESSNYVLTSFFEWKKKTLDGLKEKFDKEDNLVLNFRNENINPNSYMLANLNYILEDIYDELSNQLGTDMTQLYKEYELYLIDEIRNRYIEGKQIDDDLLKKYNEYLKYMWPDFNSLIDVFN